MLPIVIGLWLTTGVQRAVGAYTGYGRNLFVRRVQLEAERRLLAQASKVDLGHFDNSDWHDRLARAKRDVSWRPGDLTWSVLGLSGNIVTIVLMAALLASLHYVLVVLALAAAVLSLALERRVTSRMYEFFYKETPEEREREYLGDLLVQPRTHQGNPRVRAGRLPARPAPQTLRGSVRAARADVPIGHAHFDADRAGDRHDARAGVSVRRGARRGRHDRSRRRRARDRRVHVGRRARSDRSRARSSRSISTRRFSTTTSRFSRSSRWCRCRPTRASCPAGPIDGIEFDDVTFTYPGGTEPAVAGLNLRHSHGELDRARRRERRGQEHARQAAAALLRCGPRRRCASAASTSRTWIPKRCAAGSACCSRITRATSCRSARTW